MARERRQTEALRVAKEMENEEKDKEEKEKKEKKKEQTEKEEKRTGDLGFNEWSYIESPELLRPLTDGAQTDEALKLLNSLDSRVTQALDKGDMETVDKCFAMATKLREQIFGSSPQPSHHNEPSGSSSSGHGNDVSPGPSGCLQSQPQPSSPMWAAIHNRIANLQGKPSGSVQPSGPAIVAQPPSLLMVSDEARDYRKPSEEELDKNNSRRRYLWPCKPLAAVDLSEVDQHVQRVSRKKASAEISMRGIRYIFAMFSANVEKLSVIDAFKAAYRERHVHTVFALDICHPSIYWTRVIRDGFNKLLDFIVLAAEDEDDADAARFTTACRTRFIDPLKARLRDEKDKQSKRREKIDTARVARLPSIERQNESAQQAMLDMAIVHAEYIGQSKEDQTLPRTVRRCLSSLGYGVSVYRTFPGRPGEWSRMKRSAIVACLEDTDCWYIVITEHKTQ